MITKFQSKCGTCNGIIQKGEDVFYGKTEGTHHWLCRENQPSSDAERIADELGFLPHADATKFEWSKAEKPQSKQCTLPLT